MTDLYTEEDAKKISERKSKIEKIEYNKKACARRSAEDLCFDREIARLSDSMAYMLSELNND